MTQCGEDYRAAAALRDGPSGHARILSNIGIGTEVKIMWRRRDGWVEIKLPASSQAGWTREKNLTFVTSGSKVDQIDKSYNAAIDHPPNQKMQQTNPKLSGSDNGRKHRRRVAVLAQDQTSAFYGAQNAKFQMAQLPGTQNVRLSLLGVLISETADYLAGPPRLATAPSGGFDDRPFSYH
jgi:uncharacterized protein YgiM (DUF1202 family)